MEEELAASSPVASFTERGDGDGGGGGGMRMRWDEDGRRDASRCWRSGVTGTLSHQPVRKLARGLSYLIANWSGADVYRSAFLRTVGTPYTYLCSLFNTKGRVMLCECFSVSSPSQGLCGEPQIAGRVCVGNRTATLSPIQTAARPGLAQEPTGERKAGLV